MKLTAERSVWLALVASRAPGEPLSSSDRRLLLDLARQAGVAVHAVRLSGKPQRARERLVAAREEERDLDDLFFEARYQRATPRERAVLHAIAALGGESATVKQLIDKANLKNNEVQSLIGYLVDRGLLYCPSRGVVAFTAPMFGAYLRRTVRH